MINKFMLVWCLSYLCSEAGAGKSLQFSKEPINDSQCNFNVSQNHNVTDLLQCMNELANDFFAQNNGRSTEQPNLSDSLAYRENPYVFPFGDLILNLFNNKVPSRIYDLSLNPAASYSQLNYPDTPDELSNQSGGFEANLFDALSSISRYDDFKCVPRILCEVASGKLPGEYKQASTYLDDLKRNLLTQWLGGLDVAETSPVLNFARATVLGYSSRGNPATCYHAFPRCPRNPDKLVHYLNNYNGGFFRFFSGHGRESYPQSRPSYASRGNPGFLDGGKRKALPPGYAGAEADRTGTGKLKFDIPILSVYQDYEKSFFPKENIPESSGRVVFPVHEEPNDHPSGNRISKSLSELQSSDVTMFSQGSTSFFPQESEDQDVRVSHFTPQLSNFVVHNEFRFPR